MGRPRNPDKPRTEKQIAADVRAEMADYVKQMVAAGMTSDEVSEYVRTGKKGSRAPRIEIDMEQVRLLASRGMTVHQVASVLSAEGTLVTARTLFNRMKEPEFKEEWQHGQNIGKGKLRGRMFALAMQQGNLHVAQRAGEFLLERWDDLSRRDTLTHSGSGSRDDKPT